jgi:tripartite-type tricarboxylate transporter receptor subunit TctC
MNRFPIFKSLLAMAATLVLSLSHAQTFPQKPVQIKVAYPAGGGLDAFLRALQPHMQTALGQPVVVENLPGASGSIAAYKVKGSPADGHTLLATTLDLVLAPLAIASVRYAPDEFRPIGYFGFGDMVLVSSPKHSFGSVDQLIDAMRSGGAGQSLSIAHWGRGSMTHLFAADMATRVRAPLLEVPYMGLGPIIPAMLGDQVDLTFMPFAGPVIGLLRTGKLKAIAVSSETRHPDLPDVPAFGESKHLRDVAYTGWAALFVPATTPQPVVDKLNQSMNKWLESAEGQATLRNFGTRPFKPLTLKEGEAFYQQAQKDLRRMAVSAGIKAE